ncbi:MAG: heparan-alpha-glucosaminide N-acetyltransferase domain-containing protein, partial [Campylobacterota bacterium]|nr:heparan-alpha-glucosaminide N-acetyltransferase domain-containing protein [Campylobacterota bacterium]
MENAKAVKKERFEALDILRGLSMVIMALDHARDFFALGFVLGAPTDIELTNMEVFLTRWITHFAAPVFIFLAGIGLYFASARRSKFELATLAFSRGIWLIFLELTLVGFFWCFSSDFIYQPKIGVLFVIGVCMIAMAGFIYLPKYLLVAITAFLILGHNAFDGIRAQDFGTYAWVWQILHENGSIYIGSIELRVIYSFIPWIGVMAFGYLFGPVTKIPREQRKQIFMLSGIVLVLSSLVLRYFNIYGESAIWSMQESLELSIMSFLNFSKYPPSL